MGPPLPTHVPKHCILVATDFSRGADAALDLGLEMAAALNLPLVLLHVVHDPSHAPGFYNVPDALGEKARKKHRKHLDQGARTILGAAEDMLDAYLQARRQAAPDNAILADAETALVIGTPATRITEVAHERNARMIVMGSRGRGALSGILLGSTANRVVQLSRVPVTLVKSERPPETAEPETAEQAKRDTK